MMVKINCTSHMRELLGTKEFDLEIGGSGPEVRLGDVLRNIEKRYKQKNLKLLSNGKVADGLLIFRKTAKGGLERIPECSARVYENDSFTLASGMEGG